MTDPAATALAQADRTLREAARAHKRSAAAHRRSNRELMRALDDLRAQCAELGIELVTDDQPAKLREQG